jgi:hypothetical protein
MCWKHYNQLNNLFYLFIYLFILSKIYPTVYW